MPRKPKKRKAPARKRLTDRERKFVRLVVAGGMTQAEAYLKAGYTWRGAKRKLAIKACELAKKPHVAAEIARIGALVEKKAVAAIAVTRDSLTQQLQDDHQFAYACEKPNAAVSATMGLAKLHGLLIDKKELLGKNGGPVEIKIVKYSNAADEDEDPSAE